MVFSGVPFLYYFLPGVLICYFLTPRRFKNTTLLISSLVFYAWGEPRLVLLMILSILLGYCFGRLIEISGGCRRRLWLTLSVISSLLILGYFKYADFFITNFNTLTGLSVPLLKITLPIGISFYTFQIMSYTVDVYRRDVPAQKNIITLAAYVALFPQLIAGPIVRYRDIAEQLNTRPCNTETFYKGFRRFAVGLAKKVFIANQLGELCQTFRDCDSKTVLFYWMYAVAFTLHIYFDFSGYSDMAIGLGGIFGFRFGENFDYPYVSKSIGEFWRRWHISLGSWFRDYVYFPLGGSRVSTVKWMMNILCVWLLTGFWHGAAWNFILWGLFYALLLIIEKLFLNKLLSGKPIVSHIYVMLCVILGFVLFNAADLRQAWHDIISIFGFGGLAFSGGQTQYYLNSSFLLYIISILGCTPFPKQIYRRLTAAKSLSRVMPAIETAGILIIMIFVTAYLADSSFNPFLYFRF